MVPTHFLWSACVSIHVLDVEESKIKVRVSNINNENEYSIDYAVESWRERNTGVDSLND